MNLSKHFCLTRHQHTLLNKGLSFVPSKTTATRTRQELRVDLKQYHRRLKLAAHFGPKTRALGKTFTYPSDWEPHPSQLPTELLELIDRDGRHLSDLQYTSVTPNLPPEEREALHSLKRTKDIVIKPADKGSVTVIMDKAAYVSEALRQLHDTQYYTRLPGPIYTETANLIAKELRDLHSAGYINKKQLKFLTGQTPPRPRYFYLLPKIHKPMDKWTIPQHMPPGRPIVSDCGSESYGVAEYLDHFLTPLSTKHGSYVRDTQHFLERISALTLTEPCFLFTMDVNSLYTNIEIPLGMEATRKILTRHPDPSRPDESLLRLLEINLTRNDFLFQDDFYLQIKGTAMGKRFAPAYANIYMADWEDTVFSKCDLLPLAYVRYLDDIWGVWTHSREDFEIFVQSLNSHHASIKVEPVLHETEVHFLDTTIFKGPKFRITGKLDSKLYVKPTDNHALLHRDSYHPKHVFTGILKSQMLRFSRICTRWQDCEDARRNLFRALKKRGYSRSFLRKAQRTTHNSIVTEDHKQKIPLVLTFSAYGQKASRTLKNNFETVLKDSTLSSNFRMITAFRKNPNLKQLLVRAKLSTKTKKRSQPCGWLTVFNKRTGFAHKLPRHIPVTQKNCVYVIKCTKCHKLYIGETGNALNDRLNQHRYVIRTSVTPTSSLIAHFLHHGLDNLTARPLEHDPSWTLTQRRQRERHWIRQLDTFFPRGLNDRRPCTPVSDT